MPGAGQAVASFRDFLAKESSTRCAVGQVCGRCGAAGRDGRAALILNLGRGDGGKVPEAVVRPGAHAGEGARREDEGVKVPGAA